MRCRSCNYAKLCSKAGSAPIKVGGAFDHWCMATNAVHAADPVIARNCPEFGPLLTAEQAIRRLRHCARKLRELQGPAGSRP